MPSKWRASTLKWPGTTVRPPVPGEITIGEADDRYHELQNREHLADGIAKGKVDPAETGDFPPLTPDEHLQKLALGAAIARFYQSNGGDIHGALTAGSTWKQIADAAGTSETDVQAAYRKWLRLRHDDPAPGWRWRMSDEDHAAALRFLEGTPAPAAAAQPSGLTWEYNWQHNGYTTDRHATPDRDEAVKAARTRRSGNTTWTDHDGIEHAHRVAVVRRQVTPWEIDEEF